MLKLVVLFFLASMNTAIRQQQLMFPHILSFLCKDVLSEELVKEFAGKINAARTFAEKRQVCKDYNKEEYWTNITTKSEGIVNHFPNWFSMTSCLNCQQQLVEYEKKRQQMEFIFAALPRRKIVSRYKSAQLKARYWKITNNETHHGQGWSNFQWNACGNLVKKEKCQTVLDALHEEYQKSEKNYYDKRTEFEKKFYVEQQPCFDGTS